MVVREVPVGDLLDRLEATSAPRSAGLHLSSVYKVMMKRLQPQRFDKRDATGNPLPFDKRRTSVGQIFERALEKVLAEVFATERPGEIFSDEGIAMTPDGVNPTELAGEEYKSTDLSCKDGIFETVIINEIPHQVPREKFVHYFVQMKGYAKWLGVTRFILTVLFQYGDYRWHKVPDCYTDGSCATGTYCGGGEYRCGPVFKRYAIVFTQEEIDQNWEELMRIVNSDPELKAQLKREELL